jgi:hypothetical protein
LSLWSQCCRSSRKMAWNHSATVTARYLYHISLPFSSPSSHYMLRCLSTRRVIIPDGQLGQRPLSFELLVLARHITLGRAAKCVIAGHLRGANQQDKQPPRPPGCGFLGVLRDLTSLDGCGLLWPGHNLSGGYASWLRPRAYGEVGIYGRKSSLGLLPATDSLMLIRSSPPVTNAFIYIWPQGNLIQRGVKFCF